MSDGVVNLLKPPAMSSHDVVRFVRRIWGQRRVGHAGTLDPFAAGVLLVCMGRATRLVEYLMDLQKCYLARIRLGVSTDTHDITGRIESRRPTLGIGKEEVEQAVRALARVTEQVPPLYSALRVNGERGYERARRGEEFSIPSRPVRIDRVRLVDYHSDPYPTLLMEVTCGKGTYIRSMARDLGDALGTGAVLTHLLRTFCGHFMLKDARTLEEIADNKEDALIAPAQALTHLPTLSLDWAARDEVVHGILPSLPMLPQRAGSLRLVDPAGDLVAVAEYTSEKGLRLRKVFA